MTTSEEQSQGRGEARTTVHVFRDDALGDLDAVGLAAAIRRGEVSPRRGRQGRRGPGPGRRRPARRRPGAPRHPGPRRPRWRRVRRGADLREGQHRLRGPAHGTRQRRVPAPARPAARRLHPPAAQHRRHGARQDPAARVRLQPHHGVRGRPAGPQSLAHRPLGGRLLRRQRRPGRRRCGAGRARQRRRGLHPHPGRLLRTRRTQAHPRPDRAERARASAAHRHRGRRRREPHGRDSAAFLAAAELHHRNAKLPSVGLVEGPGSAGCGSACWWTPRTAPAPTRTPARP